MPLVNLRASGLNLQDNYLELSDNNALITADNIVIDRQNIIESRRGFHEYSNTFGSLGSRSKQILQYRDALLNHYDTILQYDTGNGALTAFSGAYSEVESGLRIKGQESNGNFYFTTSEGIRKISALSSTGLSTASGYITSAGAPKSTDLKATLASSAAGFFTTESKVAYRVVWGSRDVNSNLILGSPSPREILSNSLVTSLTKDFNSLLNDLDVAAAAVTTDLLSNTDYFQTLRLDAEASADDLRLNLLALTEKIDQDFRIAPSTSSGVLLAVSAQSTGADATIAFNAPVTSYLVTGDKIRVSGFAGSPAALNNTTASAYWTVTLVSGPSVVFTIGPTATFGNTAAAGTEIVESYNYRAITVPGAVTGNTFSELEELKTYYNTIIENLDGELEGRIDTSAQPVGDLATEGSKVELQFSVPKEITTFNFSDFFYQVYRTEVRASTQGLTLSDIDPGDEMGLILEDNPVSADITNGYVTIIDETPDNFRGLNLYTNPNSGDGILQANEPPPVAKDITLFKNTMFYSNTRLKHKKLLTLLGTGDLNTPVSTAVTAVSVASNVATLQFNSAITGSLSVSSIIALEGFDNASAPLNGVWQLSSVSGISASFANTAANFSSSTTADFGSLDKCENITFRNSSVTSNYYFTPQYKEKSLVVCAAAATLNSSGAADYFVINSANDETSYYVWMKVGTATDPAPTGKTGIQVTLDAGDAASIVAQKIINSVASIYDFQVDATSATGASAIIENLDYGIATDILDVGTGFTFSLLQQGNDERSSLNYVGLSNAETPAQQVEGTAKSLIRIINRDNNGFLNGFYISGTNDTPGKMNFETRSLGETTFYINASTTGAGRDFDPSLATSGDVVASDNELSPNRIYFSKTSQPEAVPIVNYFDVGPKDSKILRILPLRDGLFILKEDALYRLSGDNNTNFSVFLFDSTAKIIAADSAVILNNNIYCISTEGVLTISDSGSQIISRPIENQLNILTNYTNFNTSTFGIAYSLDKAYLLWTVTNINDTVATQCYRYNYITGAWTRWDIAKTCGILFEADNKLYLGPSDLNKLEQERKNFDRTDYADRDFSISFLDNGLSSTTATFASLAGVAIGDAIVQTQYITITDVNRLLRKLDIDPIVMAAGSSNFYSALSASMGVNLANKMNTILTSLDTYSASTGFTGISSATAMSNSSPSTIQTTFNQMSSLLNSGTAFAFGNYATVTGTSNYEVTITNTVALTKQVTIDHLSPFVVGPATIYNKIDKEIVYVPQHFGAPSNLKQVREATFIFEANNFLSAMASYSSDLNPGFESIFVSGQGTGLFGSQTFGEGYFGGGGAQNPIRTYIPQQKQRCRYINVKFEHSNARERFAILGISLVGEVSQVEARAYR